MTDPASPLVYIVVLNWNGWRDTIECLDALQCLRYPNYRALVVDNGSSDGSEERIRAAHPEATLLQSGANRGFAGGNNLGLRRALAEGATYVWLLNNDALAEPMALDALVERARTDARIGFVGSKIVYADRPDRVWFAGGTVLPHNGAAGHVPCDVPDDDRLPGAHETDYLSGCSLLVDRRVIEEIGGLPEAYFLYYEDVDWQFSARRRGWKSLYEPASVVRHKVSASVGTESPIQVFHAARSRTIFVRRHFPRSLARSALYTLRRGVVRYAIHADWVRAGSAARGLLDGASYDVRHGGHDAGRTSGGDHDEPR